MLLVDNGATACISNKTSNFISILTSTDKVVKGFGGEIHGVSVGTIKWNIEDNEGITHDLVIPNSYYVK